MKRFYFAKFRDKAIKVTKDGKMVGGEFSGMMVDQWALVYGPTARQALQDFKEGNVSKWFSR